MIVPVPHDPRPGAPGPLTTRRHTCLMWATVALRHMQEADGDRKAAIAVGDDEARDDATRRILDARSIYMEFLI